MVRALASHARGRRFKSYCLYQTAATIVVANNTGYDKSVVSFCFLLFSLAALSIGSAEVEIT